MSSYATAGQLAAYAAGTPYAASPSITDPAAAARLLDLVAQDLDAEAFVALPRRAGLPKLDVADLDPDEVEGLVAAACAQAVYRVEMGPEHFVRAQRSRVSGRAYSAEGALPIIGPQAARELASAALWRVTATVGRRSRFDPDRWQAR